MLLIYVYVYKDTHTHTHTHTIFVYSVNVKYEVLLVQFLPHDIIWLDKFPNFRLFSMPMLLQYIYIYIYNIKYTYRDKL